MSVSMTTALTIQGWPDTKSIKSNGIYITTAEKDSYWSGFVYLAKGGNLHSLLLSTKPTFESEEAAMNYLKGIVTRIRNEQSY